jgi:hypothetical protein
MAPTCLAMFTNGQHIWPPTVCWIVILRTDSPHLVLHTHFSLHVLHLLAPQHILVATSGMSVVGGMCCLEHHVRPYTHMARSNRPRPGRGGRRARSLPIWPPEPSCLQIYLSPAAASGGKRVKHIPHTGDLPGPACCSCPCVSLLGSIRIVLFPVHLMLLYSSIVLCSWSLEFALHVEVLFFMLVYLSVVLSFSSIMLFHLSIIQSLPFCF